MQRETQQAPTPAWRISRSVTASAYDSMSTWIRSTLGALHRWWAEGRHYRPERRYMRGGQGYYDVSDAQTR
jgi:hypothetical protein